ncbi:hypothetical protein RP20_CCG022530 [Aedes albopictus]|nr:hypothetical protein RP20_CCG022530 [Aedes albopictus]
MAGGGYHRILGPMTNNVAMVRNAIRDLGLRDWVPTPTYYLKRKWRKNSQR